MQSRVLRHFLAVAKHNNVSAAAEALHISQPALTKSIKQLESTIGVQLFERHQKGVLLTREGKALARRARLMEVEYQHALAEISAIQQGIAGTLRIAAGPVWLTTILPPVIIKFNHQYPGVKIELEIGVISTIVPALLEGDIDLACCTLDFPSHPEIVKESLVQIKHSVIASSSHPLFQKVIVTAKDLAAYSWVVLARDNVGENRVRSYFAANGLEPPVLAVKTHSISMMKIIQASNFLAHIPARMLPDAAKFDLVPIPHVGTFWESSAGIASPSTSYPKHMVESFKVILREHLLDDEE
ncbi:MAG: LysR family transcriptional regulator [Desulfuromusa sp.]|nr:LysR family transcriptional regulator [Desulfuromusa sp.]